MTHQLEDVRVYVPGLRWVGLRLTGSDALEVVLYEFVRGRSSRLACLQRTQPTWQALRALHDQARNVFRERAADAAYFKESTYPHNT